MSETPQKLYALADDRITRGNLTEGMVLMEAARETAVVLGDGLTERRAWTMIGRVHCLECEPRAAWKAFAEVVRCAEFAGDEGAYGEALARQAFLAYDAGDLAEAETTLDRVPASAGLVLGYRGNIARSRGRHEKARRLYLRAIDALEDELMRACFSMDLACLSLLEGDTTEAWRWLEHARGHEAECDTDVALRPTVAWYRSLTLWALGETDALADQARAFAGERSGTVEFFRRCHSLLVDFPPTELSQAQLAAFRVHCPPIEHARLATRILRVFSKNTTGGRLRLVLACTENRATLGGESSILFSDRSAEWRILKALAERRLHGGEALSVETLISIGWPREKMLPKPARNRLHVALSGLRKKGLRQILLRDDDGYALGQPVEVTIL